MIIIPLSFVNYLEYYSVDFCWLFNYFISDYVGHMRLVNGQTLTDHTVLDEVAIAEKRHLCFHVQTHE